MKSNEFYTLNAFTGKDARGNQACVLMLDDISDTRRLHHIAQDINLPATTFLQKTAAGYKVRWFAPDAEIGLCGHGTIAATWVLSHIEGDSGPFSFEYQGGTIVGEVGEDVVSIQADAIPCTQESIPEHVKLGFNGKVVEYHASPNKQLVVLKSEEAVRLMKPDWNALRTSETFGYVITAQADAYDCVSRVILPYVSFLEDQATGSAHMLLTPFWAKRLGKDKLHAFQASRRGGEMYCTYSNSQVRLTARCALISSGVLQMDMP